MLHRFNFRSGLWFVALTSIVAGVTWTSAAQTAVPSDTPAVTLSQKALSLALAPAETRRVRIALPADAAVDAEVDLGPVGEAYGVAVRLDVSLPGLERAVADRLIETTHLVCPYSRATHGNIEVTTRLA